MFLSTAVTIGAALVYTQITRQVLYRSTTRMVVSPSTTLSEESDLMRSLDTLSRGMIIPTFAEIFQSNRVFEEAFKTLGLSIDNGKYKVNAYNLPETNILVLSVTGPDAEITQKLANETSKEGKEMIVGIYPMYTITTLEEPHYPYSPIGSDTQRNLVMAVFLGAGLGFALALLVYGDISELLGLTK